MTRKKTHRRQPLPMQTTRQSAMSFFGIPGPLPLVKRYARNSRTMISICTSRRPASWWTSLLEGMCPRRMQVYRTSYCLHQICTASTLVISTAAQVFARALRTHDIGWRNESLNGGLEGLFWDLTVPARTAELSETASLLLGIRTPSYLDGHGAKQVDLWINWRQAYSML